MSESSGPSKGTSCKNHTISKNINMERILDKINEGLPTLPAIVTHLLNLIFDSKSSVNDISKIIKADQAAASKLLRMVNSAAFGLSTKISNLDHAITILGFDVLKNLLLSLSVFDLFGKNKENSFNKVHLWRHSLAVAIVSKGVALHMDYEKPDEAYVAGLLHDIGKVIISQVLPEEYNNYLKNLTMNPILSLRFEEESLSLNHALVGKLAFEKWNFPPDLQKAIYLHHGTDSIKEEISKLAAIVSAADFICWTQSLGSFNFFIHPTLNPQTERAIDFKNLKVEAILNKLEQDLALNAKIFNLKLANVREFREALQKANFELGRINFLYEEIKKKQQKQIQELNALNQIIYKTRQELEPFQLIRTIMEEIMKEFGFTKLVWFSVDFQKKMMVPIGKYGDFRDNLPFLTIGCEWNDKIGFPLYNCVLNKEIIHVKNFENKSELYFPILYVCQCQEMILIPISTEKVVTNLLLLGNTERDISPDTIQVLDIMAINIGLTLENAKLFQYITQIATIDPLTGIYNRRQLDSSLVNEIKRANRFHQVFSLAMFDIDNFKAVNDTYGHLTGDLVLKDIASIIRKSSRDIDILGRFGGDEFLVILPNNTLKSAIVYAERIRLVAERYGLLMQEKFPGCKITISIGVTEFNYNLDNVEKLLKKVDKALYQSKKEGRNRVKAL